MTGELTPVQEATKAVFAFSFVVVMAFVCAAIMVMIAPYDPSGLYASFSAGVVAALLVGKALLRGVEASVNTLGEVTAHPVLFLSALTGLAGLLFGLELVPTEYPAEIKLAFVAFLTAGAGSLPFLYWAIHCATRWAFTRIESLVRPTAEKAVARVKAVPERARGVHLAAVKRVSRVPLLIKALAGGVVAVGLGTISLLTLPPLIVPQASEAPRIPERVAKARPLRPRPSTPVLLHPRAPAAPVEAPRPEPEEIAPPVLHPVAVMPPYRSPYLRFFQRRHSKPVSRKRRHNHGY